MERIVIATNNEHKLKEFREIFSGYKVEGLSDIGFVGDIEENGKTFCENAIIKAKTISEFLASKNEFVSVLADDSGLCVNALKGAPGIFSARYAGGHGDSAKNREKLLKELKNKKDRSAYFECDFVCCNPDGSFKVGVGKVFGHILDSEVGDKSFGYDCLFYCDELKKCFGECTSQEKNSVSHRARAIADLKSKEK